MNNMCFNGEKFQHIRYGRTSDPGGYSTPDNNPITTVEEVMDLGVIMEASGKFQAQIRAAAQKGGRNAGWVQRVFAIREKRPMLILFKDLVLSALEYC